MMTKTMQTMMCAALALVLTTPAFAQDSDGQQAPPPPGTKPGAGQPELSVAAREMTMGGSHNTNVKFELTITDQRTEGPAVVKTVSATVVDRSSARIRTSGAVRTPMGMRDVVLNVDATPTLVNVNGVMKMRLSMSIEYRPVALESDTEKSSTPTISETITVVLEDGKPLVISQSADPATDRKVKVEVKASIMR
jgi:hypothetical protein